MTTLFFRGTFSNASNPKKTALVLTSLLSVALLDGCGTDTGTGGSASRTLANELVGTWKADTTVNIKTGAMSVPVGVGMKFSIATNGTFSSFLDATLLGTPIQGHLFVDSGTWTAKSADTVVLHPTSCYAADTATTNIMGMFTLPLPFQSSSSGYTANALKPSPCPDSVVIDTHPVNDSLRISMPVAVPLQGSTVWSLAFAKQP